MPTPMQQVSDKCKEVFASAARLYGVDCSKVTVRFDLKGRAGGMACARGYPRSYFMRFNHDMMLRETEEIVNVVVPHEIAHIVCFMKPELGRNHDYGWARVCRALGGTGDRTHGMEVVYGKGTTYEYITDRGNKIRLNERRHAIVQQGRSLTYRKGLGTVTQQCAYSVVGVQGRTLAAPIVKKIAETKELPVNTFLPPIIAKRPGPVALPLPRIAPVTPAIAGGSKADVARSIMVDGYRAGRTYEQIIAAIMLANGHDKRLASSYYKNNALRVGVPMPV